MGLVVLPFLVSSIPSLAWVALIHHQDWVEFKAEGANTHFMYICLTKGSQVKIEVQEGPLWKPVTWLKPDGSIPGPNFKPEKVHWAAYQVPPELLGKILRIVAYEGPNDTDVYVAFHDMQTVKIRPGHEHINKAGYCNHRAHQSPFGLDRTNPETVQDGVGENW